VRDQLDGVVLRTAVRGGSRLDGALDEAGLSEEFIAHFRALRITLERLQARWEVYQHAKREGFAEEAGLHTRLGPADSYEMWSVAEEFIDGYREATKHFSRLFGVAGDRAPRLAAGPLGEFMDFGLYPHQTESGERRVRMFGYHPLRLALFAEIEREAHRELRKMLDTRSSLREIPVSVIPPTHRAPAVVWPPTGARERKSDTSHIAGERRQFFVPSESDRTDFWSQDFAQYRDASTREPDLIEPLRPLFRAWAEAVFPGMKRRAAFALHSMSDTDHGIQSLRLCADLVGQTGRSAVIHGIDLRTAAKLRVPASVRALSEVSRDGDELEAVARAFSEERADDPKFPLEVFSGEAEAADGPLDAHVTLLVRPWQRRAEWVVRDGATGTKTPQSMVWDKAAQSWDTREAPSQGYEGQTPATSSQVADFIEQRFQELLIRRWRGEADQLRRVLGRSLEASPVQLLGDRMKRVHTQAATQSLRVVVVDSVFGAEAVDDGLYAASDDETSLEVRPEGLRVTYADYHRNENAPDWRITVIGTHGRDAERRATESGLRALYELEENRDLETLGNQVYEATHRATPRVLREVWTAGVGAQMRGELIGHMGVSVLTSCSREPAAFEDVPEHWSWLAQGFPPETILLSMDSLQSWMWTRRGGTRGDFLAVVPFDDDKVRLVAIESKGSRGTHCYRGASQARTTARKLEERFGGASIEGSRDEERRELLRVLGREAFRARANHREVYDRIASGGADALKYEAVCISTARESSEGRSSLELEFDHEGDREVAWVKVRGAMGLQALAGCLDDPSSEQVSKTRKVQEGTAALQ
ncbi:MAG: hypothetical protein ACLFVJ_11825, partial [Persicimonas sp.]